MREYYLEPCIELKNHIAREAISLIENNKRQNLKVFIIECLATVEFSTEPGKSNNLMSYAILDFIHRLSLKAKELGATEPSGSNIRAIVELCFNQTLENVHKKEFSQLKFNLL